MGQDYAQFSEWNEDVQLEWNLLEYEEHQQMQHYVQALTRLYKDYPALYAKDYDPAGFEWINGISADENMLVFMRHGESEGEDLIVVCNFSPLVYENHKIGVPYHGKYKEIFNSDLEEFGGSGNVNSRAKTSKKSECDEREDSIMITVPPMGISVFSCTRVAEKPAAKRTKKGSQAADASKEKTDQDAVKPEKAEKETKRRTRRTKAEKSAEAAVETVASQTSEASESAAAKTPETAAPEPKKRGRRKKTSEK
jgi:1,4-alpha-glucan branching enzyme